jgi:hypothetical protein
MSAKRLLFDYGGISIAGQGISNESDCLYVPAIWAAVPENDMPEY